MADPLAAAPALSPATLACDTLACDQAVRLGLLERMLDAGLAPVDAIAKASALSVFVLNGEPSRGDALAGEPGKRGEGGEKAVSPKPSADSLKPKADGRAAEKPDTDQTPLVRLEPGAREKLRRDRLPLIERVHEALRACAAGGGAPRSELVARTGLRPQQVASALQILRRGGRARCEGKKQVGRWFAVEVPPKDVHPAAAKARGDGQNEEPPSRSPLPPSRSPLRRAKEGRRAKQGAPGEKQKAAEAVVAYLVESGDQIDVLPGGGYRVDGFQRASFEDLLIRANVRRKRDNLEPFAEGQRV